MSFLLLDDGEYSAKFINRICRDFNSNVLVFSNENNNTMIIELPTTVLF